MGDLVSDDTMQLLVELREEVPLPTDDVARAIYASATKDLRRRPIRAPRRFGVVVILAVLAFSAAAFAAVREAPWWQTGSPAVDPRVVVSVARDNMPADVRTAEARTVVTDGDAALVAVPLDQTGYCLIPALRGNASLGASCIYSVSHPERGDSDSTETASRAASKDASARWLAYGRITDPRAAKIDLGALTVDLSTGGFFLVAIPETDWAKLSGTANPGSILDSSGSVLRRGCVNWGSAPGEDSSRFSSTLWLDQSGACKPQEVPPMPTLDFAKASKLFDVTLTMPFAVWKAGQQITFEKVPASDGTTCAVPVGPGLPTSTEGCSIRLSPTWSSKQPIDVGFSAQLAHDDGKAFYAWQITGTTDLSAGIAKVTVSSPAASASVAYGGGFFFAELPVTTPGPVTGGVPFPDGPWVLTAYDTAGHEVARIDLTDLHASETPH
jgi:hypothetical protein